MFSSNQQTAVAAARLASPQWAAGTGDDSPPVKHDVDFRSLII
jgi:hypothetical protein